MNRVPLFIEVIESKEHASLQICRKVMAHLFRQKIAPLPFGGSAEEIKAVLASMRLKNMAPAIFVINTYWAEELLQELDPMMGQTPVLFFRRNLIATAASSAVNRAVGVPALPDKTSLVLSQMTERPHSVWGFGTQSVEELAEKAATSLIQFLKDGNFLHIERGVARRNTSLQFAMSTAQENIQEFRLAFDAPTKAPSQSGISAMVGGPASSSSARLAAPRGLHGTLEQMGLSTLLVMIEMEKKSGELVLTRDDKNETVRMYIKKGRLIAAYAEGDSVPPASRSGAEAVYYVLGWTTGQFDFAAREIEMEDKINQPMASLLMEGARRLDESGTA